MLNANKIAVVMALACCAVSLGGCGPSTAQQAAPVTAVFYFCRTIRCPSCEKIEALTKQTVERCFAGELAKGHMVWRSINIDEPAHAHFDRDYKLQAQSVVLSESRGGIEVRWKNLDRVWDLVTDDAAFVRYIEDETRTFLRASKP